MALVTGAAQRLGAAIARRLHGAGMDLVVHYRSSSEAAARLVDELNGRRPDSATAVQADLLEAVAPPKLVAAAQRFRGRLDVLVNNASTFYPTPVPGTSARHWDELVGSNLRAPFFVAQHAAPHLAEHGGCIVNLVDIHAERPLRGYPVYSIAKAGMAMLTRALALELGPRVRVNGVAPGAILWPQPEPSETEKARVLARSVLGRRGDPDDIARAVLFLVRDAGYVTGQVLAVDGGQSVVHG